MNSELIKKQNAPNADSKPSMNLRSSRSAPSVSYIHIFNIQTSTLNIYDTAIDFVRSESHRGIFQK